MIPGNRVRAKRRSVGASSPIFDKCLTNTTTGSDASISITVSEQAQLVILASNNIPSGLNAIVDGVTLTALGSIGSSKLYTISVSAGTHTVTASAGGSWRTLIVSSYIGVTSVSGIITASASSVTPSITPSGSGAIAVGGFQGVRVSDAATVSNGDIRGKQVAANTSYNLALADKSSAPVTLTQSSSSQWYALGIWLN